MLSNSLKVTKLLNEMIKPSKVVGQGWKPDAKASQPSSNQNQGILPKKMLNQDSPSDMPMSSDLNIYPHSIKSSIIDIVRTDTNTKEKGSPELLNYLLKILILWHFWFYRYFLQCQVVFTNYLQKSLKPPEKASIWTLYVVIFTTFFFYIRKFW